MANEYRTWYASTEQEYITQMDEFLRHVVGWYRVWTLTDSGSDRRYTWMSEGEVSDNRPPRLIGLHAVSNEIRLDGHIVADNGFNLVTGAFGNYIGAHFELEFRDSVPGRCRSVASKDRVCPHLQTDATSRLVGYLGFIDSFYSPLDDPSPMLVRGQNTVSKDWTEDIAQTYMLRSDNTEQPYQYAWNLTAIKEGYPNPRDGSYSFYRPFVYYNVNFEYNEIRGRLKGVYYARADRLAHGSFVKIGEEFHLVTKTTDEADAIVIGPVSSTGQQPVNYGWQARPNLETDYTYRGLEVDLAVSGTLALWRFDTGHLDTYVYGSASVLPVPTTYEDAAGNYELTAQNGVTSEKSRLREAIDLDGSTHYASATGDGTAATALKEEWTFECVFMPDIIPTVSDRATLIDYGSSGAAGANNTLIKVAVSPAVGATPDVYNVERGNIEISWEKGTGTLVSNVTSGDFVQQGRWNYLAIVKRHTGGSSYDIDIWHCSFGDHLVPTKKATFTGMDNATSGTSSAWYIGTTEALASYFDGRIDDTRITERVLSDEEILTSCSRTML